MNRVIHVIAEIVPLYCVQKSIAIIWKRATIMELFVKNDEELTCKALTSMRVSCGCVLKRRSVERVMVIVV